jgi:succinate-acetate transporter protein
VSAFHTAAFPSVYWLIRPAFQSFANPTALGVITFSLSVTVIAGYLLGFQGTSAESMPVAFGMFFLSSGLGLTLAGIFEFIIGNTCEYSPIACIW